MKAKFYHTFYYLFSYLSDKTNGASIFVKYKLALGIILVGLTTVSCSKDEEEEPPLMCYDPVIIPQESAVDNMTKTQTIDIEGKLTEHIPEVSRLN